MTMRFKQFFCETLIVYERKHVGKRMCILPCTGWRGGFGRQGLKLSQQAIANWLLNISEKWL